MSTVFDVSAVTIDGGSAVAVGAVIDNVTINDAMTTPNVTITNPDQIETLTVEVPGIQGPPGLKNVFIEAVDPSDETWGMDQLNFIWIPIT